MQNNKSTKYHKWENICEKHLLLRTEIYSNRQQQEFKQISMEISLNNSFWIPRITLLNDFHQHYYNEWIFKVQIFLIILIDSVITYLQERKYWKKNLQSREGKEINLRRIERNGLIDMNPSEGKPENYYRNKILTIKQILIMNKDILKQNWFWKRQNNFWKSDNKYLNFINDIIYTILYLNAGRYFLDTNWSYFGSDRLDLLILLKNCQALSSLLLLQKGFMLKL